MNKYFFAVVIGGLLLSACNKTAQTSEPANAETAETTANRIEIKELSNEQFVELVGRPESDGKHWHFASKEPIIVDFYATWCGPCKKMAPNMELLAKEYEGKVTIYKVDVDKAKQTAGMFGIYSIPSLLFVNPAKGQLSMQSGYQDYSDLKAYVKEVFGL